MAIFKSSLIFLDEEIKSKTELFNFISSKLCIEGVIKDKQYFLDALNHREKHSTTALGNLFAVPHGILDSIVYPVICVVRMRMAILWKDESDDPFEDENIRCVFCLAIPSTKNKGSNNLHVALLSEVCSILLEDEQCTKILSTIDSEVLLQMLTERITLI